MRSDFGLLGCILNIDSPDNRLAKCSVRFIYMQHQAALGWLFGGGRAVDSACASNEVITNLIRLFVGTTAEEKHLEMITTPHNSCG